MPFSAYAIFKWTVYSSLVLLSAYWFVSEDTLSAFADSLGWLILLGVMEYESSTMDRDHGSDFERHATLGVNLVAYTLILSGFIGYINDQDWVDAVNAGTWIAVSGVLAWQIYVPGEYVGAEYKIMNTIKVMLYSILIVCAIIWTMDADTFLDAADAWLWLLCFAVIEMNVFGFENASQDKTANA